MLVTQFVYIMLTIQGYYSQDGEHYQMCVDLIQVIRSGELTDTDINSELDEIDREEFYRLKKVW